MKNSRKNHMLPMGIVFLFILLATCLMGTSAASITVTTTSDVLDAAAGCATVTVASLPGPDGVVSLREAMCAANNNTGPDTIHFNIGGCPTGCTIQPTIALPVMTDDETAIDGYTQPGASPASETHFAAILIELDGTNIAANNGLNITSGGNVIRGLAINNFPWNGIAIGGPSATGNTISGNYIGANLTGTSGIANDGDGVYIGLGASLNLVGGDEPAERNIICSNGVDGVAIHGSTTNNNTISGNYIGTTVDGLSPCPNAAHGVYIYGGAYDNSVGGHSFGEWNLISGNAIDGIRLYGAATTENDIAGNLIGVDITGAAALPNGDNGISIQEGSFENRIGGDSEEERNIISGNDDNGIYINDADNNEIVGNFIGLDSSGMNAIPNGEKGIYIVNANDNTIGYELEGNMNFISGNQYGIVITGDPPDPGADVSIGNWIRYNAIGLNYNGDPLGNTLDGIHLSVNSQQNKIGPQNWIVYNGDDGVSIDTPLSYYNRIYENFISRNDGKGINLTNGSNSEIDPPVIVSAPNGSGTVSGTACPGCTVELFFNIEDDGEGMAYFGSVAADGIGDWEIDIPATYYPYLTATMTDLDNNTSEFSDVYTMLVPRVDPSSSLSPDRTIAHPGEVITYTLWMTNTGTASATGIFTNTIPYETSWVGNTNISGGTLDWQESNDRLVWTGTMEIDTPVVISYQVRLDDDLEDGHEIDNTGQLDVGLSLLYYLSADPVVVEIFNIYLPLIQIE